MKRLAACLVFLLATQGAWSAPPTQGDYRTDISTEFTNFPLTEFLYFANFWACAMGNTLPGQMFNRPRYLALVDFNACLVAARAGTAAATAAAGAGGGTVTSTQSQTPVMAFSVLSTQASGADPQVAKGHGELWGLGGRGASGMYFHLKTLKSPAAAPPNGEYVLNVAVPQPPMGTVRFRISVTPRRLTMVMAEGGQSHMTLVLEGDLDNGVGQAVLDDGDSLTFAYSPTQVCTLQSMSQLALSPSPDCFSRLRSDATLAVAIYSLYDDITGNRFLPSSTGITVRDAASGEFDTVLAGHVGLRSGVQPGQRLIDVADGTQYQVQTTNGLLMKVTLTPITLDAIDGIVYRMDSLYPYGGSSFNDNYEVHWNQASGGLVLTAHTNGSCGLSSSFFKSSAPSCPGAVELTPKPTVDPVVYLQNAMGATAVLLSTNTPGSDRGVLLRLDSPNGSQLMAFAVQVQLVSPGELANSLALDCTGYCPTADDLAGLTSTPSFNPVYTWDDDRYALRDQNNQIVPLPSQTTLRSSWPQISLTPSSGSSANGVDVSYRWFFPSSPGDNVGFLRRTLDNVALTLVLPRPALFTAPLGYDRFGGLTLPLVMDADGGLAGIPNKLSCSGSSGGFQNCQWVPAFSIADQDQASVQVGGQTKWVRRTLSVIEFASTLPDPALVGQLATLPTQPSLPSPDVEDPSDPANTDTGYYPGLLTEGLFDLTPSVAGGVKLVQ